jgi:cell wall-associated NlpC family hydrolase
MQPGDLVFFRTAGRHGRISHVGIYIDNGQFIHSPSRGETVRVDKLSDSYWSRRFAGAKRPEAIAQVDTPEHNG